MFVFQTTKEQRTEPAPSSDSGNHQHTTFSGTPLLLLGVQVHTRRVCASQMLIGVRCGTGTGPTVCEPPLLPPFVVGVDPRHLGQRYISSSRRSSSVSVPLSVLRALTMPGEITRACGVRIVHARRDSTRACGACCVMPGESTRACVVCCVDAVAWLSPYPSVLQRVAVNVVWRLRS